MCGSRVFPLELSPWWCEYAMGYSLEILKSEVIHVRSRKLDWREGRYCTIALSFVLMNYTSPEEV